MTTLSTHVLDTALGKPASGVSFTLQEGDVLRFEGITNEDGRCSALKDLVLTAGRYRLVFSVADYFAQQGIVLADPPFLETIPIFFGIGDEGHYHVPLLLSPYGYSTYRGS